MSDIRQLYQRIIVDHANYPHHYGELKTANYKKPFGIQAVAIPFPYCSLITSGAADGKALCSFRW